MASLGRDALEQRESRLAEPTRMRRLARMRRAGWPLVMLSALLVACGSSVASDDVDFPLPTTDAESTAPDETATDKPTLRPRRTPSSRPEPPEPPDLDPPATQAPPADPAPEPEREPEPPAPPDGGAAACGTDALPDPGVASGFINEAIWWEAGCFGYHDIGSGALAVTCNPQLDGSMIYTISAPELLPNRDPVSADDSARVWLRLAFWYDSAPPIYLDGWMYTDLYVRLNLADNTGHWESSGTWFDGDGNLISSNNAYVVNTAFIDGRAAVAIDWLYWWDASDSMAAGSSYDSIALADLSPYC